MARRASPRGATVLVALVLLAASCRGGSEQTERSIPPFSTGLRATTKTCIPTAPVPPNNQVQHIAFEGKDRTYVLSVPPGYDGTKPAPLIFDFYGRQGDAQEQVADYELDDQAIAAGMLVVTPQAAEDRDQSNNAWSTDIPLVQAILQSLNDRWCIDDGAVFTAGFSDGGVFSAYLACALPGVFAAVGSVAEVDFPPDCPDMASFSVIGFHGKSDPAVPYDGGARDKGDGRSGLPGSPQRLPKSLPVEETFAAFAAHDGCTSTPSRTRVAPGVEQLVYPSCKPGSAVELYSIDDGGHEWPGDPGSATAPPGSVDANRLMVQFFLDHARG
ncbi:MAG: hypothetical protein HYX32_06085 [Actinobacteria bacterium]|nr:hypothetical protein [Actinomycetota bacterium]